MDPGFLFVIFHLFHKSRYICDYLCKKENRNLTYFENIKGKKSIKICHLHSYYMLFS